MVMQKADLLIHFSLFIHYWYHMQQELPSALHLIPEVILSRSFIYYGMKIVSSKPLVTANTFLVCIANNILACLVTSGRRKLTSFCLTPDSKRPIMEIVWCVAIRYKSRSFQEALFSNAKEK